VIVSFSDAATGDFFHGRDTKRARRFPHDIAKVAHRKLDAISAATTLDDLKVPPGNRLEALKGNLAGSHSIRINQQWRIVFQWKDGAAHGVKIDDYH
jgi:proteic killer suppression protein